jgi:hypothetical protein
MSQTSNSSIITKAKDIHWEIFGLIGALISLIAFLISSLFYIDSQGHTYSILNYFVSELGNMVESPLAAVFNYGLILGGSFLALFMIGLYFLVENKSIKIASIIGIFSAISTICVGIFPMNTLIPHAIAAMGFFYGGMFTVIIFTVSILLKKATIVSKTSFRIPIWIGIVGIIVSVFFVLFHFGPADMSIDFGEVFSNSDISQNIINIRPDFWGIAFTEWLVVLGVIFWILFLSIVIIIQRHKKLL